MDGLTDKQRELLEDAENVLTDYLQEKEARGASCYHGRYVLKRIAIELGRKNPYMDLSKSEHAP